MKLSRQEIFWEGDFGKNYIERNKSKKLIKETDVFFERIFRKNKIKISSIIELGSNIGNNLNSLSKIFKTAKLNAVEINKKACYELKKRNPKVNVINESLISADIKSKFDLVLTKGVLIHINPKQLNKAYSQINKLSNKYILIAEYYNTTHVNVIYRGKKNKLFKRDFAGELIKKFNYKIIDYGFVYRYDKFPQDDITWFLLKKK